MTTMIATTLPRYDGKPLKPGQRFEVSNERDVRTLVLTRKAEVAKDDGVGRNNYKRRDMKAE